MANTWPEITAAKLENRYELKLSGSEISKKIESNGIDKALFSLSGLNFLQCSDTCLDKVPEDIGNLDNLTSLLLHSNKIFSVPPTIGRLTKLKILDLSGNKLENLPSEISNLTQISILNLRTNALKSIPSLVHNTKLTVLDFSGNRFEEFPDILHKELIHLSEVKLQNNAIKDIPATVNNLTALKLLDMGDNAVTSVPGELSDIPKLKDLNLKGNKLSDRRLMKMVDQCHTKQVLDYIRQHAPRTSGSETTGGKGKKVKKGKKSDTSDTNGAVDTALQKLCHHLEVFHVKESTPVVKVTDVVKDIRPHIACCIVRGIHFTADLLKKFIQLQTRLHDSVCEKRNVATIATHDLALLPPGDLTYTALPPNSFTIHPLSRNKELTGRQLYQQLQHEADELRKDKKRNTYSGIHRYLYLLEGKPVYPVLLNSQDKVISFPPITNSDATKLSLATTTLFLEVTSAAGQGVCRKIMDTLLSQMLKLGMGDKQDQDDNDDESILNFYHLNVEQVKVVDLDGNLKIVYPARNDLDFDTPDISVIRE